MNELVAKPFKFGILGCGAIGPTHVGALRQIDGAEVVAVCDLIEQRARDVATKNGIPRVYNDYGAMLADPSLDAVSVCTPSGMHADQAVTAMRAGKHVVIEKPIDVSLAAADRIIEASRQTGRHVGVISQHRFDGATQLARQIIDSGELGRIVLTTADVKWWRSQGYYDSGDWRGTFALDGGGALMNQGVHTVDVLQWLAGDVTSVFAHVRTSAHERIEVEDVAVLTLQFANGAVGQITATTAAYDGFPVRIELFGTEGSILLEGDTIKQITLKSGKNYTHEQANAHAIRVAKGGTASVKNDALHRPDAHAGAVWGDAHRAQFVDFIDAVRTGRPPAITASDARKPLAIILAAYASSKAGQVVNIGT
jgi:predicted dehydrogenase